MQMRIKSLKLTNFKGIKSFELEPTTDTTIVSGKNGTGKTTLVDAWLWLLFGKDSRGQAAFEIKTLDTAGLPVTGVDHRVDATVRAFVRDPNCPEHGGRYTGDRCTCGETDMVLSKTYKEKWAKKRGSAQKEFTGHTTDHFIDGVPVKKNEFEAQISSLCQEDAFRLLTDPVQFAERLHWQERRALLLKVCGDVSDEDVIASDNSLSDLSDILGNRSIADHRKVILARRTEINKALERIPVRIDESQRAIVDLVEDQDKVERALQSAREKLQAHLTEKTSLLSGGRVGELEVELKSLDGDIQNVKIGLRQKQEEKVGPVRRRVAEAEEKIRSAIRDKNRAVQDIKGTINAIDAVKSKLETDEADHENLASQEFEYDGPETCPTCGRKLTQKQFEDAKKEAKAAFNDRKSGALKKLHDSTADKKAELVKLGEVHQKDTATIEEFDKLLALAQRELGEENASLVAVSKEPDFANDPEISSFANRKATVENEIAGIRAGDSNRITILVTEIDDEQTEIARLETIVGKFQQIVDAKQRKVELRSQERILAAEYEDLERQLWLADEFTKSKVGLLESRINDHFKLARFKMFKILVNGGLEECCEVTYDGVPYTSNLNHGAQIQVGLDIISALQVHYQFAPPVWIDQSESFSWLPEMDCQLIKLCVDATHEKLSITNE